MFYLYISYLSDRYFCFVNIYASKLIITKSY